MFSCGRGVFFNVFLIPRRSNSEGETAGRDAFSFETRSLLYVSLSRGFHVRSNQSTMGRWHMLFHVEDHRPVHQLASAPGSRYITLLFTTILGAIIGFEILVCLVPRVSVFCRSLPSVFISCDVSKRIHALTIRKTKTINYFNQLRQPGG